MIRRIHPVAGALALATIVAFWTGTAAVELLGTAEAVAAVKRAILWGLIVLIPAIAAAGATGFRLGAGDARPPVATKRRRMPFVALNGIAVLVPCAVFLDSLAAEGRLDGTFYAVQAVELAAGAVNIALLALNLRDGLRLRAARTVGHA